LGCSTSGVWVFSLIEAPCIILHQIGTPFGRFSNIFTSHEVGRPIMRTRSAEREGLNADTRCECVRERHAQLAAPPVSQLSACFSICVFKGCGTGYGLLGLWRFCFSDCIRLVGMVASRPICRKDTRVKKGRRTRKIRASRQTRRPTSDKTHTSF
jgi:hypothetical protein